MELLTKLIDAGVLVTPDLLEDLEKGIISSEVKEELSQELYEEVRAYARLKQDLLLNKEVQENHPLVKETPQEPKERKSKVTVVVSHNKPPREHPYDDFVQHFRIRYTTISNLLKGRTELQGATSINRILANKEKQNVAIIGMITEKILTKNNNLIFKIEDLSGEITLIVTQKNKPLFDQANDLVLDEIVGITGTSGENAIFPEKIIHPDIPLSKELKKQKEEEYMVLVGDSEIGGKHFLKESFEDLIAWLNGEMGTEQQKAIAKKVQYVIFIGDVVSGVGVYPGQEKELEFVDLKDQYVELTKYLNRFPKHVDIIICPGNHDAGRLAEPQPPIAKEYAAPLYDIPNVIMVSNPALINLGRTDGFPGFDVLLYHGYSLIYYSDALPSARNAGGQKATDRIMKFLLQRRHLAPTHTSNLYIPDPDEDPMVISTVPDFFLTGHIHRIALANYRNVTMINGGAWTDVTESQTKRGLEPQPARLPIVNLKTRAVSIMNFYKTREESK